MHLDRHRDIGHYGYSLQQSTRPQTIGYGLADSPIAQAAWIYEKLRDWSHHDGNVETVFSKDEMLDTIMLYWLSNSGTSSARYYWECEFDSTAWPIDIPVGVSWFPGRYELWSEGMVRKVLQEHCALEGDGQRRPLCGVGGTRPLCCRDMQVEKQIQVIEHQACS